ncbi:MAG: insulinase family protein, partial [Chloroflexi bacterium]|nr:insulinase family protein [Chloroflexota bacterium]
MEHQRTRLPNGLRIVSVSMPAMRSVTAAIFLGVGSRYEPAHQAGVCHMIEHMLFKGTERRRRVGEISGTIESVGGILNASTDKDATVYWAKVDGEHLPLALDLLADMLCNSRLRPADLAREKDVVLEELNMLADEPQEWVHVLADEVLWPGQPVGREVAGTPETVRSLTRRTLRDYLDRFYGANNAVVSVAGGARAEEVAELVAASFGGWAAVSSSAPAPAAIPADGERMRLETKTTEQVHLCLVYPGVARDHPDRWALDVLCTLLGGSTSSRLFLGLRERLGLAYDVHAFTSSFSDTGSITIYAGTDGSKSQRVLDEIAGEVERMQRRRPAESEMMKVKQYLRGRLWLGLEDTWSVANWFGGHELFHQETVTPEAAGEAIEGVTAEDVRRVARAYLG